MQPYVQISSFKEFIAESKFLVFTFQDLRFSNDFVSAAKVISYYFKNEYEMRDKAEHHLTTAGMIFDKVAPKTPEEIQQMLERCKLPN